MIEQLSEWGVEINWTDGDAMAYAPGLRAGAPGQLKISRKASYSAWLHEYQHVLDDKDMGWGGMKALMNHTIHQRMEINAYDAEIKFALQHGYKKEAKRLDNLKRAELARIWLRYMDDEPKQSVRKEFSAMSKKEWKVTGIRTLQELTDAMLEGDASAVRYAYERGSDTARFAAVVATTRYKMLDADIIESLKKEAYNDGMLMGVSVRDAAVAALDILGIEKYEPGKYECEDSLVTKFIGCGLWF